MQKDPFGFKTQGNNYQNFRPRYPNKLIEKCILNLKNKNRFLDIATGTGYLLFALAPNFQQSVGSDISDSMLKVSQQKAKSHDNITVVKKDCMGQYDNKFNLVTIGQALHWLPLPNVIEHISKNILQPSGRLVVFSYYVQGIKQLSGSSISNVFDKFSLLVEPEFDFDRHEIYRQYSDQKYAFKKHFNSVQKYDVNDTQKLSKQSFIGYMKTYSGYNRYKQKYQKDPIIDVEEGLKDHSQLLMTVRYFAFYCDQPIQK